MRVEHPWTTHEEVATVLEQVLMGSSASIYPVSADLSQLPQVEARRVVVTTIPLCLLWKIARL